MTLLIGSARRVLGNVEKVVSRTLNGHLREYLDVGMIVEAVVLRYETNEFESRITIELLSSVDKDQNKCLMKLTDQFIEKVQSKRFKGSRLSRSSSVVSARFHID